jgi:thioredoxin reductase (NADPH)
VLPIIVVAVDAEARDPSRPDVPLQELLLQALRHRYDRDYEVVGVPPAAVAGLLDEAAASNRAVAAVVAGSTDLATAAEGVRLLAEVRGRAAGTQRILVVERGGWRTHPVREAMVLGHVDGYLFVPWALPEQWLYSPMGEYLTAWHQSRPPVEVAIRIVGRPHSPRSHALRDILSRAGVPHLFLDSASEEGRRALGVDAGEALLPALVYFTGRVLLDPSDLDLIELLGFSRGRADRTCDVLIVGAGPAGLSAAVYAASEGLEAVAVDPGVPGGQAGTSSMIRNYLGFPRGLSGSELTNRALEQAWLFGTEFLLADRVVDLRVDGERRLATLATGGTLRARAVVIATGVSWRRLGVPALESLVGAGVFYGAAGSEAAALHGQEVLVVGGGNSAGQAAVHLAKHAAHVAIVVRRDGLAASMSDYLVQEIANTSNISVRARSRVVDGGGAGRLERITVEGPDGRETLPAAAVFVMIGAEPETAWLPDALQRDPKGYLLTGSDVDATRWPLDRAPMFLETSLPGVFAVGDVAHGSTKRVAPSVGTGGVAIELVHRYLAG